MWVEKHEHLSNRPISEAMEEPRDEKRWHLDTLPSLRDFLQGCFNLPHHAFVASWRGIPTFFKHVQYEAAPSVDIFAGILFCQESVNKSRNAFASVR